MPAYLTPEWFTEADALLRADTYLAERSHGISLVLEQRVRNDAITVVWHVQFADGVVSLKEGSAEAPDVVFVCNRETADGIRNGTRSAQAAFIAGELRVEGSINALLQHGELFASLNDALGPLR